MSFADELAKKTIEIFNNTNPASVYLGTVQNDDPMEISLEAGIYLNSNFLIIFKDFIASIGDPVALLRVQGKANSFIVLGVIV